MKADVRGVQEIKKLVESGKAIIGAGRTVKAMKLGRIAVVYLTSNLPERVSKMIMRYAALSNAEVVSLKATNDELGITCKKPFRISVLSVPKE